MHQQKLPSSMTPPPRTEETASLEQSAGGNNKRRRICEPVVSSSNCAEPPEKCANEDNNNNEDLRRKETAWLNHDEYLHRLFDASYTLGRRLFVLRCETLEQVHGKFTAALHYYGVALKCKHPRKLLNVSIHNEEPELRVTRRRVADVLFDIGCIHLYNFTTTTSNVNADSTGASPRPDLVSSSPSSTNNNNNCSVKAAGCMLKKSLFAFSLCLDLRRICLSNSESSTLATVLYYLTLVYEAMGRWSDAFECAVEAIGLLDAEEESNHNDTNSLSHDKPVTPFDIWITIGRIQQALGQMEDAQSSFEEAGRIALQQLQRCQHNGTLLTNEYALASVLRMCQALMCSRPTFRHGAHVLNEVVAVLRSVYRSKRPFPYELHWKTAPAA